MTQWVLYAIEVDDADVDKSGQFIPELMCRYDEHGPGSALIWTSREDAEEFTRELLSEASVLVPMRVVELTLSARFPDVEPDA